MFRNVWSLFIMHICWGVVAICVFPADVAKCMNVLVSLSLHSLVFVFLVLIIV